MHGQAILIQQVLGIDVTIIEYPGSDGALARLASGRSDVSLEMWPNNKAREIRELVLKQQLIAMTGALGYVGRISWYFPAYIADLNPNIIFSSWGSMLDPNLLRLLPRAGTTLPQRTSDGSYLCSSWYCQNGEYVPPQCQGAAYSSCREFWHVMPEYSTGMSEQRILDFGLPLVVVYLGPAFIPTVSACIERQLSNSTCLLFHWVPETLPSRYLLQPVHFPPATPDCLAEFNLTVAPSIRTSWRCDWETDVIQKFASVSVTQRVPPVHTLLHNLVIRDTDIADMLSALPIAEGTAMAACAWTRQNEHVWRSWIPPPPSDYVKNLVPVRSRTTPFAIALALLALLIVINLLSIAGLARFRSDPLIRIQSPALVAAVNLGALMGGLGSSLDLPFATDLTPALCAVKTAMLILGLGSVLVALLAKTWRVFYIFSNLRLSLVVAGQLFRLNVSNAHLAGLGGLTLAVYALLVAFWIVIAVPQPVQVIASSTTFTYRCGSRMDLGPPELAAMAIVTLIVLYHWTLAGFGLFLAHRIRSLAVLNNESTATMVAMSGVTLPTVFIAMLQFTPGDPFLIVFAYSVLTLLSLLIGSAAISMRPLGLIVARGSQFLLAPILHLSGASTHPTRIASIVDSSTRRIPNSNVGALTRLVNQSLDDLGLESTRNDPSNSAADGSVPVADVSDEAMAAALQAVAIAWRGIGKLIRQSVACRMPVLVGTHMGRRDARAWWWTPWQAVSLVLITPLQTLLVLDCDPWATRPHHHVFRDTVSIDARAVAPESGTPLTQAQFLLVTHALSPAPHATVIQCRDATEARRWIHAISTTFVTSKSRASPDAGSPAMPPAVTRWRSSVSPTDPARGLLGGSQAAGTARNASDVDAGKGRNAESGL
ncbi:hypothetical protein, variant [Allomyces macrogynus ATCC 38327]|uniref:G-protein coupled receptors family 3 profile domain-containing protein n=1 Tax=Allomyces macrogynus (strain ATCC 38327) TaxID=578462 RepID=A0A0L0RZY9_ALLM3|nr:hypothetical protein, variant [Allomyces macrogynus ATCC 38327]|eukprot:KNE55883.1 hypothetical protein, variant [Allomyces macrogynus ATCC 38327]